MGEEVAELKSEDPRTVILTLGSERSCSRGSSESVTALQAAFARQAN